MPKTVYVIAMMRTSHNEGLFTKAQRLEVTEQDMKALADNDITAQKLATELLSKTTPLQAIFDDPIEAVQYAINNNWWPFCVEQIQYFPKGEQ